MECEVYSQGGDVHGTVRGRHPHFDSPVFSLDATDRHYAVLRMRYHGRATRGVVRVRSGTGASTDAQSQPASHQGAWSDPSLSFGVPFEVSGDGQYHVYYAPIWEQFSGHAVQLRVQPIVESAATATSPEVLPGLGDSISIDWIKIVKAPRIFKVEGCINRYYEESNLLAPGHNVTLKTHVVHTHRYTSASNQDRSMPPQRSAGGVHRFTFLQTISDQTSPRAYGTTYNCLRHGGERITITGTNFGVHDPSWARTVGSATDATPTVSVGGRPCTDVVMTIPQSQLQCNLPVGYDSPAAVIVSNNAFNGLYDTKPYLSYAAPPAPLATPVVVNVAAASLDVTWVGPSDYWDALAVTGYAVWYREVRASANGTSFTPVVSSLSSSRGTQVVGNVTYTTVVGLRPGALYEVRVAGISEDQDESTCVEDTARTNNPNLVPRPARCRTDAEGRPTNTRTGFQWRQLDLYGRRAIVEGGLVGAYRYSRQSGKGQGGEAGGCKDGGWVVGRVAGCCGRSVEGLPVLYLNREESKRSIGRRIILRVLVAGRGGLLGGESRG